MVSGAPLIFVIQPADAGQRLDRVIARLTGFGRRRVGDLFAQRCVRVDGNIKRPSHTAAAGEQIEITTPPLRDESAEQDFELRLVREEIDWVVVDKPAGQPSVPLPHRTGNSVAELLLRRYPEMLNIGYRSGEAGLLHRLDTGTSGLLLAARNRDAFIRLRQALQAGQIEKAYFAVVASGPQLHDRVIDLPLGPHPKRSRRVVVLDVSDPKGKAARTEVHVLSRAKEWTLLDIQTAHAYRHQIRAHLAHLGFPLVGDTLYGGPTHPSWVNRHALHAHRIAWPGDGQIAAINAESALPPQFAALLDNALLDTKGGLG